MVHSSTRVTQDIYIHVRGDMYDRFFEATGELLPAMTLLTPARGWRAPLTQSVMRFDETVSQASRIARSAVSSPSTSASLPTSLRDSEPAASPSAISGSV